MKILIVGGVAGGATAAARARRLNAEAEITMLEAGPDVSFANCGLPYYIGGDIENRSSLILQSPESFKDQYNVIVHTETEVTAIDAKAKSVTALDKKGGTTEEYTYDKLILAQGGRPLMPPIPGIEKNHVFSLWTLADMDAIHSFIEEKTPKSAAVIGGGFIGLEMAEALTKRGLKVNIIERLPQVMATVDPEIAGYLQEELIAYGVDVHTSKALEQIHDDYIKLDDGTSIAADMVLMSVGVKPTLELAKKTGLAIGDAGGLLVDQYLQTSDESIYAAGDMVELEHRVSGKKVRIPLAGPANRQGRIAASNALAQSKKYAGSQGTSIVRVFEAVAGSTGLTLKQARDAGIDAESITIHKENHTSYYPGSEQVTVVLVFDKTNGRILGGQTAGYAGADRRLDVIATAIAGKMTVHDLADQDFAYSPPLGTANDPINMAAFAAENKISGYGPSIRADELDEYVAEKNPVVIDLRDYFAFQKAQIRGANNMQIKDILNAITQLPKDANILVMDATGKKGHQAVRMLIQAGFENAVNMGGGFTSLMRHARTNTYKNFMLVLPKIEAKSFEKAAASETAADNAAAESKNEGPLVIDVRSPGEFAGGAYPGAVNITLDILPDKAQELGSKDTEIILYCASGARSAYGARILQQLGFTNIQNGGGLMDMMMSLEK